MKILVKTNNLDRFKKFSSEMFMLGFITDIHYNGKIHNDYDFIVFDGDEFDSELSSLVKGFKISLGYHQDNHLTVKKYMMGSDMHLILSEISILCWAIAYQSSKLLVKRKEILFDAFLDIYHLGKVSYLDNNKIILSNNSSQSNLSRGILSKTINNINALNPKYVNTYVDDSIRFKYHHQYNITDISNSNVLFLTRSKDQSHSMDLGAKIKELNTKDKAIAIISKNSFINDDNLHFFNTYKDINIDCEYILADCEKNYDLYKYFLNNYDNVIPFNYNVSLESVLNSLKRKKEIDLLSNISTFFIKDQIQIKDFYIFGFSFVSDNEYDLNSKFYFQEPAKGFFKLFKRKKIALNNKYYYEAHLEGISSEGRAKFIKFLYQHKKIKNNQGFL